MSIDNAPASLPRVRLPGVAACAGARCVDTLFRATNTTTTTTITTRSGWVSVRD